MLHSLYFFNAFHKSAIGRLVLVVIHIVYCMKPVVSRECVVIGRHEPVWPAANVPDGELVFLCKSSAAKQSKRAALFQLFSEFKGIIIS